LLNKRRQQEVFFCVFFCVIFSADAGAEHFAIFCLTSRNQKAQENASVFVVVVGIVVIIAVVSSSSLSVSS
jgi:hypothetical protein